MVAVVVAATIKWDRDDDEDSRPMGTALFENGKQDDASGWWKEP